jgi:hypothetical protein
LLVLQPRKDMLMDLEPPVISTNLLVYLSPKMIHMP